ncbi:hypothetical protein U2F26_30695 [Micromonospora sp. 4G57]|uniref:Uncharacterized protein n=1 Tax=Micromonospora sicca TaxID=2202420 RepID=A0A317DP28_9ACTN|nr:MULTISPECIES: hypothetical protein [unclassified Micromonospora]MDZ5447041.1 hypothetical protein [Micromonospora sp. 4G57]MDZ5493669.1 hypothetical protein [Micromonospora sp. 4G53]PWR16094.1 hypothetical protein DKT69_07615 [Micromonospora sp. 4G51]
MRTSLTPTATLAVAALTPFRPRNRREAAALLATWARRDTLTPADVAAVLATFRARGGAR